MLSFESVKFRYEPYPIGVTTPALDPVLYGELVDSYPDVELFQFMPNIGDKYSLSERNNPKNYDQFIASHPRWRDFHAWVKAPAFIEFVGHMLLDQGIDLGLGQYNIAGTKKHGRMLKDMSRGRLPRRDRRLNARFEFSMLPADGGYVHAHTDTPRKIITLIVSMVKDGEWSAELGGGTDVNRPKDPRKYYNWLNKSLAFDEIEILDTFDFLPNQCVIFVKTFNSLHSVRPMTNTGNPAMRRTLTINIETDE